MVDFMLPFQIIRREIPLMLKIDYSKWNQTPQNLRQLALVAVHPRTRERYLALYEISQGKSATQVSVEIGRRAHTVIDWVHHYNIQGKEALVYHRTGGKRPLFL